MGDWDVASEVPAPSGDWDVKSEAPARPAAAPEGSGFLDKVQKFPLVPPGAVELARQVGKTTKAGLSDVWEGEKRRAEQSQKDPGSVLTNWAGVLPEVGSAVSKAASPITEPIQQGVHAAAVPIAAGMAGARVALGEIPHAIDSKVERPSFSEVYGQLTPEVEKALGLAIPKEIPGFRTAPKLPLPPRPVEGRLPALSEGQETQDIIKLQLENAGRQGLLGPEGVERTGKFDAEQQAKLEKIQRAQLDPRDTSETVAEHIRNTASDQAQDERARNVDLALAHEQLRANLSNDGRIIARNPNEAADVIGASVTRAEEEQQAATTAAYEQHNESKGLYEPKVFAKVGQNVRKSLNQDAFALDSKRTPVSITAIRDLDTTLGADARQGLDPAAKSFPALTPQRIEQARKRLISFRRQAEASARATGDFSDVGGMRRIQDAFDGIVTEALRNPKLFSGDGAAVADTIENARALHADLRRTFSRQGTGDDAGAFMQRIVGRGGVSAPSVEIRKGLYGNGPKQVKVADHLMGVFGEGSPEHTALKQGYLSHFTEEGGVPLAPEKQVANIRDALDGEGRDLSQRYLSPQDQARLRAYADRLHASTLPRSGPSDAVSKEIDKIVAGANPEEVDRTLYGRNGDGSNPAGVKLAGHVLNTYGPTSEPFQAIRNGQMGHLVDGSPAEIAKKVEEYLDGKGRSMSLLLHSPMEREAIRVWGEFNEKLKVMKGSAPHSGSPQFINPEIEAMRKQIARLMVGHIAGKTGIPFASEVGYGATAAVQHYTGNAAKLRQLTKQMPLMAEKIAQWEKEIQKVKTQNAPLRNATVAAANLGRSLSQMHPSLTLKSVMAEARHLTGQDQEDNQTNPPPQRKDGGNVKKKNELQQRAHGGIVGYADGGGDVPEDAFGSLTPEDRVDADLSPELIAHALTPKLKGEGEKFTPAPSTPLPPRSELPGGAAITVHPRAWHGQELPEGTVGEPAPAAGAVPKEGQSLPTHEAPADPTALLETGLGAAGFDLPEAGRALRGEQTPDEAKKFAFEAAMLLAGGPEMKAAKAGTALAERVAARLPHPGLIDQRLPSVAGSKLKNLESTFAGGEPLIADVAAMQQSPKLFDANVNLMRNYPNMPISWGSTADTAQKYVNHLADNLVWLYGKIPQEVRDRSKQWYVGGNKIVSDWAGQYSLPDTTVAGMMAALSPNSAWNRNVANTHRMIDILKNQTGFKMTPEMEQTLFGIKAFNKPMYKPAKDAISGKSLADIDQSSLSPEARAAAKAMWVRVYDETYNPRTYQMTSPEGEFIGPVTKGNGEPAGMAWTYPQMMAKAVRIFESGGYRDAINELMGGKHKIRNFYNNLLDPWSPHRDVTIDTHAVGAAHVRSFGGKSLEVSHNFEDTPEKGEHGEPIGLPSKGSDVSGIRGTYPVYADAYRQAADRMGILPRELQSITWEALRGMFPEDWKSSQNSAIIDNVWRQFKAGKISADDAREKVFHFATKDRPDWFKPDWARQGPVPGAHEGDRGAANAAGLPGVSDGPGAGRGTTSGSGSASTAPVPEDEGLSWRSPLETWRHYGWRQEPETGRILAGGNGLGPGGLEKVSGKTKDTVIAEAQAASERAAQGRPKLEGLPDKPVAAAGYYVPGPMGKVHDAAEAYMRDAGLQYNPPKTYAEVDEPRARRIAQAYDEMEHAPNDPRVKASYDAMIKETLAQFQAIKKMGLKFDFIGSGMKDPYEATPRLAAKDVLENNHLWVFPTESGFGSDADAIKDNPLLQPTDEYINGKRLTANDVFRIVHDVFGHFKDGNGFRATGEENAWRSHSAMYSDAARPAMTAETRGQNSWLNHGPHGEKNRTAKSEDTVFAQQKIGMLPGWVMEEGRGDVPKRADGGGVDVSIQQTPPVGGGIGPLGADLAAPYAKRAVDYMGHQIERIVTDRGNPFSQRANQTIPRLNYDDGGAVSSDPNDPNATLGVNPIPEETTAQLEHAVEHAAGKQLSRMAVPGRVMQGIEPETPGMVSDVDVQKALGLDDDAADWARFAGVRPRARGGSLEDDDRGESEYPPETTKQVRDPGSDPHWIGPRRRAHGGRVEPNNINHNPTEAQKRANNHAHDHLNLHGFPIAIENAKGSMRRGIGKDGKPWASRLNSDYGYIKGTVGRDKQHIDVYLGPHKPSEKVFVVDQVDAETKRYDEAKILLCFGSRAQAIDTYRKAFSDGKGAERIGKIHEMTVAELKHWLENGDTTKPFSRGEGAKSTKSETNYRAGSVKAHCGICTMFRRPSSCTAVEGKIAASALCDLFERK